VASSYPGSLDSFDTIASDKKTSDAVGGRTHRQMHNDLGDAIEAVQTELGTDPAGASATVKARFEAIEANGWVTSARILDGAIVDADINASAAIARTKLAQPAYAAKTSAYTATTADDVLNVTSGTFTIDLPAANTCAGKTLRVKNSGTGVVTLDGNSSETVEGVATFPLGPSSYIEITSTGSAWILTGGIPDTCWRNVSSDLANGWTGGTLYIRRVGNRVAVRLSDIVGTSASSNTFYSAPVPFWADAVISQAVQTAYGTFTAQVVRIDDADLLANRTVATGLTGEISWTTDRSWPTSLPGSAV